MKYFYSAAVMGYGDGKWWHKYYDFPFFPRVTKTLTIYPIYGNPLAVVRLGSSVYNRIGLCNISFGNWIPRYYPKVSGHDVTVSLAGTDKDIELMIGYIEKHTNITSIELNYSCPNVKSFNNRTVPYTNLNVYLKLNYKMDPYQFNLSRVRGIRLNSIPLKICGGSGKVAKEKNWSFIEKYKELNVAGCSFNSMDDINKLEDMGCTEIGIGSTILTNPKLICSLR